jgi:hypothetical protein
VYKMVYSLVKLLFIMMPSSNKMNPYRACRIYLSACFNSKTARRIFTKYGMDIMPLKATPNFYFLIFYDQKYEYNGRTNLRGESGTLMSKQSPIL